MTFSIDLSIRSILFTSISDIERNLPAFELCKLSSFVDEDLIIKLLLNLFFIFLKISDLFFLYFNKLNLYKGKIFADFIIFVKSSNVLDFVESLIFSYLQFFIIFQN